jgi:hypothetical protein
MPSLSRDERWSDVDELVELLEHIRVLRRDALDALVVQAEELGLYEATADGPPGS